MSHTIFKKKVRILLIMQHWAHYNKEVKIFILLPSAAASASLIFSQFIQRLAWSDEKIVTVFGPWFSFAMVNFEKMISISIEYKVKQNNSTSIGQFKIF
jgi:hypothetical protein